MKVLYNGAYVRFVDGNYRIKLDKFCWNISHFHQFHKHICTYNFIRSESENTQIIKSFTPRFVKQSYISISFYFCKSWTHIDIDHWDSFALENCYFIARLSPFCDLKFSTLCNRKYWNGSVEQIFKIIPIKISYCPFGFPRVIFFAFIWLLPFTEILLRTSNWKIRIEIRS